MHRTHVRWDRVAALVVATSVALTLAGRAAGAGEEGREGWERGEGAGRIARPPSAVRHAEARASRVHVVRAGETLWGLARRLVGPAGDPRPVVDGLIEANGLAGGTIHPGDRLVVPAPAA